MKVKPARNFGTVVVELGPNEHAMPGSTVEQPARSWPAFQLRRILVPIDFSACSVKALQYAVPFAKQFGASISLLYVGHPTYPVPYLGAVDLTAIESDTRPDDERKLRSLVKEQIPGGIKADVAVRLGHSADEIVRFARIAGTDLIIISTHGHTGLKHVLLGSTAESVVRYSPCPVLVVRQQEHEFVA